MNRNLRVLLLVETSYVFGRSLLRGIVRYSRLHEPWTLDVVPGHFLGQTAADSVVSSEAGVIARLCDVEATRRWHEAGVPIVALEPLEARFAELVAELGLSEILTDSRAAGRMAAEHLLERGFRHFAYCGVPDCSWSLAREKSFVERLAEEGISCEVYCPTAQECPIDWRRERSRLADFLHDRPRPLGVMACNDLRGCQVLEASRLAGLGVPDDVAVVGVDDDDLMCQLAAPPLSSVGLNLEAAGYEAAWHLDGLIAGTEKPKIIPVRPTRVVARRSTDTLVQDDPVVAEALRFIRDHATRPIQVDDIARRARVSRRTLERRFAQTLGHTILDALVHRRLERAKRLLVETDAPMQHVAEVSGFVNPKPMTRAFRQYEGLLPGEYRQARRGRP